MKHLLFIISAIALLVPLRAASAKFNRKSEIERQRAILEQARTPADSLAPLFNLYDLIVTADRNDIGFQLMHTARRAGDTAIALDIIRNLANNNMRNDSILSGLLAEAKQYTESSDRRQTVTFIRLMRNNALFKYSTPDVKTESLHNLMEKLEGIPSDNLYDRLVMLHAVCATMADFPEDDFLQRYVDQLNELVEQLPASDLALKNFFYVNAAISYTRNRENQRAIYYDQKLLQIINELEVRNRKSGRIFKSYDPNRYIIYTRLLENAEGLTSSEVEEFYKKAMETVENDPRASHTYKNSPLPTVYYNLYHKNYRKVLGLLQQHVETEHLTFRQLPLMRIMTEAAVKTGDNAALLKLYPRYVEMLRQYINARSNEKHNVLEVVYDLNQVKAENIRLEEERQDEMRRNWRRRAVLMAVALATLLVFVIILYRARRKAQRLAESLEESNKDLEAQKRNLLDAQQQTARARDQAIRADQLKTDFINNMSHEVKAPLEALREYAYLLAESTDDHKKKYLMQFADLLMLNADLVTTIVNDVLQLSELHTTSVKIEKKRIYAGPVCEAVVETVKGRVHHGVEMIFRPLQPDILVNTDRHRLVQILINLLQNAAKFTEEGSVTIYYRRSDDGRNIEFIVEDTGIGVQPENAERIFERFVKLSSDSQGIGVGLTISRMLARLMDGDITVDQSYSAGARFILTLPIE